MLALLRDAERYSFDLVRALSGRSAGVRTGTLPGADVGRRAIDCAGLGDRIARIVRAHRFARATWSTVVVVLVVAGAAQASATATRAVVYQAFTSSGKPAYRVAHALRGSCYSGADSVNRDDAWRCISGNALFDPCFSSAQAKRIVLCPSTPFGSSVVEIKLTKGLPSGMADKDKPSSSGSPWAIETTTGLKCVMDTGATNAIGSVRANYGCTRGSDWLWGDPSRSTEPWTIRIAPISARRLKQRVDITRAWF